MGYKVLPGEIAIILRPVEDDNGEWTGSLSTGLIFGSAKHEDAMRMALDMAITMAATEQFLEDYPEYIEDYDYYKSAILKEIFPDAHAAAVSQIKEEEQGYKKDGNVIHLTPWTKTEGNA